MESAKRCAIVEWVVMPEVKSLGECKGNVSGVRVAYQGQDGFAQKIMETLGKEVGSGGPYLCEGHMEKLKSMGFTVPIRKRGAGRR
jgi:hypothetical protein